MVSGLATPATCCSSFRPSRLPISASVIRSGQPEAWLQMGFQDAVLDQQVLILQEQFLVDETRHEVQKTGDAGDVGLQTPS